MQALGSGLPLLAPAPMQTGQAQAFPAQDLFQSLLQGRMVAQALPAGLVQGQGGDAKSSISWKSPFSASAKTMTLPGSRTGAQLAATPGIPGPASATPLNGAKPGPLRILVIPPERLPEVALCLTQAGGPPEQVRLMYVEFLRNEQPISSGEAAEIIVTKFYGTGTPILRYTSINDIVAPLHNICSCGKTGALIKKIYGRNDLALYLAGGNVMLPSSFSEIYSQILYQLKTNKVKNSKIIQHDLTNLEIQVVIDETIRNTGPSIEEIFQFIKIWTRKKRSIRQTER